MNRTALTFLRFGSVRPNASDLQVFEADGEDIVEGALWADGRWHRIEDGILDTLPDGLASAERRAAFAAKHGLPVEGGDRATAASDAAKVEQIRFFEEEAAIYDRDISNRSFYAASDNICFGEWVRGLKPPGLVCDIGAGSGRLTIPLLDRGFTVVSTDISEEMLRLSRRRARAAGHLPAVTYVLADAEHLPFGDALFDAATCYGALHHVPHPALVVAEVARTLRPGGRWLSYDPHRSRVRFLFDWAMRVSMLYNELASANPLISYDDADRWNRDVGLDAELKLHFFLPPHFLNLMSRSAAERWLRVTDRWFNRVGLGSFAGVIVVHGVKPSALSAAHQK